jgi:hypothetical protein
MSTEYEWTVTVNTCLKQCGIVEVTVNASDENEAIDRAIEKVYLIHKDEYVLNDEYIAKLRTRYKRLQWFGKPKIY